ncbi:MAG: ABC transporter permease, partial [Candidatus Methylomirabilales bacterium]
MTSAAGARQVVVALGDRASRLVGYMGGVSVLAGQTFYQSLVPPYPLRSLLQQMDHIGVRSAAICAIAAVFTGLVLALQTSYGLARFGAK